MAPSKYSQLLPIPENLIKPMKNQRSEEFEGGVIGVPVGAKAPPGGAKEAHGDAKGVPGSAMGSPGRAKGPAR